MEGSSTELSPSLSKTSVSENTDPQKDGALAHNLIVKWSGKEIEIEDINGLKTVRDLKQLLESKTGVHVDRQKLLNLTYKGKLADDDCVLANMSLKVGQKLMMMGSLEKDIRTVDIPPEDRPVVNNDFDIPDDEDLPIENREVYLNKIARRVKEYKIEVINPSRPGKKLLVLDIDYTLFDHRTTAETPAELMRPFLHEFLTAAYDDYDIAIWSATSMKWIREKMRLLGVSSNSAYKIAFHLDYLAMISVHTPKYGVVEVKPLGVIWGLYPNYSVKNTIMIDDLRRNFMMNPQSGLRIRAFKSAHSNRQSDRELLNLSGYLRKIAKLDDFSKLNHRKWESYDEKSHSNKRMRSQSGSRAGPSNPKR
ncbi:Ubiquitin-like domain-containing CTD phosphatase 1 [Orchesella cincta]|uniref:Ubiquitin-like domain-containing CTD phosphatase 1 n=1 Tax=Orchesella cincta TaxID=48709 RepID=A0A1D2MRI1_ORCCI|nr:Ubiquitin-like domain-containing CTD phosphatase 1 [Orchesella cincta]